VHRDELILGADSVLHTTELQLDKASILRSVKRGPLILLTLGLLLLIGGVLAYSTWQKNRSTDSLTLDIGTPPVVDPLIFKPVSAQEALKANAETPFAKGPIPSAQPFHISGSPNDVARAVDCLAATLYYEAANEPLNGQMAVAQVVINRMRHPAFPKSICGVVFQGHERRTGCQFSYTCDGSMARQPSAATWERLRALSRSMLNGLVYAPVGLATHYHANYVLPVWSSKLDKLRIEGAHIFYRWTGVWGTPSAFRGGYQGAEGVFPKLALLSPGHRTGNPALDGQFGLAVGPSEAALDAAATETTAGNDGQYLIKVDPGLDPSRLPDLAQRLCGTRDYCKVMAWTNGTQMPKGFPVSDGQFSTMAFSYLRNREQGFEKPLWNCAIFARSDKKQCVRKRVVIEGKAEDLIPVTVDPEPERPALKPLSPSDPESAPEAPPPSNRTLGRRRPGDPALNWW
jgi:Cell Wall Hydrolase